MFIPILKNDRKAFICFLFRKKLHLVIKLMKKIIAIVLLSIFLFNTVGYFIAFQSVQYQIKLEVKSEIFRNASLNELQAVTIAKQNLNKIEWFEYKKEMQYNNERYDVVKIKENSNSITFYCINDKKEQELLVNLNNHINIHSAENKPLKNQAAKNLEKNVVKVYFQSKQQFLFPVISESEKIFFQVQLIYRNPLLEINSPPPEFI